MQCVVYAKQHFSELVGGNVPWTGNHMSSIDLWNDLPLSARHGNVLVPSIAIWDGPNGGHSAVVERVDSDGRVYITEANFHNEGKVLPEEFSEVYYLGVHCGNKYTFKGYIQ